MAKKIKKLAWLNMNLFPVHVALCISHKEWKGLMKRMGIKDQPNMLKGAPGRICTFYKDSWMTLIIVIDPKQLKEATIVETAGLIAHEAAHAARFIFEHIGENTPGMETEAYIVQAIVGDSLMALYDMGAITNDTQVRRART